MNTSLALPSRSLSSLSIPGALFSPVELSIDPSTSAEDYQRIGKAISSIGDADELWESDYALWGMKHFGAEGLTLAAGATGLSKGFLKRCARIAEVFPPERRHPNLKRNHYRVLLPFDQSKLDVWLPTVVNQKRLSSKSLRALAVEALGEPVTAKQPAKRSVKIHETLWSQLLQHAPSRKASVLVEVILDEWLRRPQSEQDISLATVELQKRQKQEARPPATIEQRKAASERARKWRAAKVEKPAKIEEPANVRFQLEKFEHTTRATYAERRQKQLAEGATPIPEKGPPKSQVKIVFFECPGLSFIENSDGMMSRLTKASASRFHSLEKAEAAAREYGEDRGYACEGFQCEKCSAVRPIFHVRGVTRPASVAAV